MSRRAAIRELCNRIQRSDPLFPLALAAVCGISLGDRFPFSAGYAVAFSVLAVVCVVRVNVGFFILAGTVFFAFAAVHGLRVEGQRNFPLHAVLASEPDGLVVSIEGLITDEPSVFTPSFSRFPVRLQALTLGHTTWKGPYTVLVRATGEPPRYGDRVRIRGRIHLTEEARNPGEFDARNYYWRKGISAELEVRRAGDWQILQRDQGSPIKGLAFKTRDWLADAIVRDLENEPETQAILQAMVLGIRGETPKEIEEQFRLTGTLHIFAVSGLHVGMVAYVLWLILKSIGIRRPRAVLIIIPLILGYALVTGLRPSAVRAALMASVLLSALCFDRQARLINSLGAAALAILVFDTQQLFGLGFQLSFSVLLAIALLVRPLQKPFQGMTRPDPFIPIPLHTWSSKWLAFCGKRMVDTLSVSIAATLGSFSFVAFHFQLVTPVAIIANGFVIPLGFAILFTSVISMLCAAIPIFHWVGILLNNANYLFVHLLTWSASWFASWPGAYTEVSARPRFIRAPVELVLLDLPNQGACQHLWLKDSNKDFLIDSGHMRDFDQRVAPFLKYQGIGKLEGLFATHADATHIGGAPLVMEEANPRRIWIPSLPGRGSSVTALTNAAKSRTQELQPLSQGERIPLGDNTYIEVLFPPLEYPFPPPQADNQCLVVRLVTPSWKILLMSDSGFSTEKWLLESGVDLQSEVLIKNNHQSDISGLHEFLQAVQPIVVISEHHEDESLRAWATHSKVDLFNQSQTGAIRLELNERDLRIISFLGENETVFRR